MNSISYNVGIYIPKKDTCQLCDRFNIQIQGATQESKSMLNESHQAHLTKASFARTYLQGMTSEAKKNPSLLCFTFDIEKTQPMPYINTSVVFYKRQLWLLNLGINTRHNNQGYMCLWNKTEGKRGANEVCSALFEFSAISPCFVIFKYLPCQHTQNPPKADFAIEEKPPKAAFSRV